MKGYGFKVLKRKDGFSFYKSGFTKQREYKRKFTSDELMDEVSDQDSGRNSLSMKTETEAKSSKFYNEDPCYSNNNINLSGIQMETQPY